MGGRRLNVCWEPGAEQTFEWADSPVLIGVARSQVIVFLALTLLAFSATARAAVAVANDDSQRSAWRHWCRSYVDLLMCKCFEAPSQEERRVREEADAKAIVFWRKFFQVGAVLAPLAVFLLLDNGLLTASFFGDPDLQTVGLITWYPGSISAYLFFLSASLFFTMLPCWLTKRSVYLFLVLAHLRCGAAFLCPCSIAQFMMYESSFCLMQLLAYLHCPDASFAMAMNTCTCAAVGWILQQKLLSEGYEHGCETNVLRQSLWKFGIIGVAYFIHRHLMLSQIRRTLEAMSSRKVESSVETLLHGMCDAVVHLRPDMTLRQPSSKLSTLLLHTLPIVRGASFLDFVHGGLDKERLRRELAESGGSGLPGTLHISLRDACMCPVTVQLFHTACFDVFDGEFYIVGLREAGDLGRSPMPLGDGQPGPQKEPNAEAAAELNQATQRVPSQEGISEWTSVLASEPAALPMVEPDKCARGEIAVWVDSETRGMPMVRCTPEFSASFGRGAIQEGTTLLSWIPQAHRDQFAIHVQENVNELLECQCPMRNLKLVISPAHMSNIEIQATLCFSLPISPEGVSQSLPLLKVACKNLRYKRRLSVLTSQHRGQLARPSSPARPVSAGARADSALFLRL